MSCNNFHVLLLLVGTDGDLEKKKAGASMVVEVGSFSDPAVMPGLAHYLEHMLFMVTLDLLNEIDVKSTGYCCGKATSQLN